MNRKWIGPALALGIACAALPGGALADERPFVLGSTAVQEDDDERVWEVAPRLEAGSGRKMLDVELEYAYEPSLSVELEWARRLGEDERETEQPVDAQQRTGREVEAQRDVEQGEREGWGYGSTTFKMPLSRQWEATGTWTHLTLGLQHERDEGTKPLAVIALQQPLSRRLELFGEWGAVREREGVLHAGVRWWVKREKLALDLSVLRRRDGDERPGTVMLGLSVLDLSF